MLHSHRQWTARSSTTFGTSSWSEVFGDDVVAAAMIDRLVDGASFRMQPRCQVSPPLTTIGRETDP